MKLLTVRRVWSRASALLNSASTASRCSAVSMSMKSMMMMPPRFLRRSWRAMVCRCFEVGLEDGVVEVAHADEAAGIHVDRRHASVWSKIR